MSNCQQVEMMQQKETSAFVFSPKLIVLVRDAIKHSSQQSPVFWRWFQLRWTIHLSNNGDRVQKLDNLKACNSSNSSQYIYHFPALCKYFALRCKNQTRSNRREKFCLVWPFSSESCWLITKRERHRAWAKTGNPFSRRRHFSRAVSKRERGWLIDRDIVASLHILLFSHMSPGFFWLKPKSGCFLFLSKGACFLFLYLSVFVHCLVCAYCTRSPSPVMHIFCLRQEESGLWLGPGRVMYCSKRGALILALSKAVLVLLFHLVSICLCILLGPRVGGWSMRGEVWVRDAKGGSDYPLRGTWG